MDRRSNWAVAMRAAWVLVPRAAVLLGGAGGCVLQMSAAQITLQPCTGRCQKSRTVHTCCVFQERLNHAIKMRLASFALVVAAVALVSVEAKKKVNPLV